MTLFRAVAIAVCCLCLFLEGVTPAAAEQEIQWQGLETGLDLARVPVSFIPPPPSSVPPLEGATGNGNPAPEPEPVTAVTTVLRIDPAIFAFSLYMASESGPKTLAEIGKSENFAAAINAGMYQRDGVTGTGYLKNRTHTNNGHVAARFGSFFVAEPLSGKAPYARLLDRNTDDWETALGQYGLVMQNYRMTTPFGRVIWKQADRLHSVAALSQDASGRVLFLLCPNPVPAAEYMAALLRLPLGIRSVMYLEGGSEAALLINAGGVNTVEAGRHISGLWGGSANLMLPNILGIRKRNSAD